MMPLNTPQFYSPFQLVLILIFSLLTIVSCIQKLSLNRIFRQYHLVSVEKANSVNSHLWLLSLCWMIFLGIGMIRPIPPDSIAKISVIGLKVIMLIAAIYFAQIAPYLRKPKSPDPYF